MAGATVGMGPLEAFQARSRFAARRGDAAWRLAMHAAVPQSFRPELLHLLKLNFVPEAADDPAVEADVLLAPFSDDLGGGYFQFDPEVRRLLLDDLGQTYADEPVLRVRRVAGFLLAYVDRAERRAPTAHDRLGREFLETQRWVALAFARPEAAAEQLAAALQAAEAEPALGARLHLGGLARAVAIPLAHHRALLDYALGLHALESGDAETATDLLEPLSRGFTVGGVTLSPARVLPPRAIPARTDDEPAADASPAAGLESLEEAADAADAGDTADSRPRRNVFISNTGLHHYQQAAVSACFQLGLVPTVIQNWVVGEGGYVPLQRTLEHLRRADLYVCIVPGGYGYVPPRETRSMVEIEYDHAVAAQMPMVCFLVDEQPTVPYGNRALLAAFQEKLLSGGVGHRVNDLQDFSARLHSALRAWKDPQSVPESVPSVEEPAPAALPRKLYLSYGESERPFAERLYGDLRSAGFDVWMDVMELESFRTDARYEASRKELPSSAAMLLVLDGPIDARSFMAVELRLALEAGTPVCCILYGAVQPEDVPWEISHQIALDFRDESAYAAAFAKLARLVGPLAGVDAPLGGELDSAAELESITDRAIPADVEAALASGARSDEPAAEPGPLLNVPPLPDAYVAREEMVIALRSALLFMRKPILVTGPGGIGKSVLAAALARDETVRRQFPDGIVWVTVGGKTDPDELDVEIWHALGAAPIDTMASRRVLVILDDVADERVVQRYTRVGERGQALLISRNENLATGLYNWFAVPALGRDQALELLARTAGVSGEHLPPQAAEIAELAGYVPAVLSVAGADVRKGASWGEVLERLRSGEQKTPPALDVGPLVESLSALDWRVFRLFGLFPVDEVVDEQELLFAVRVVERLDTEEAHQVIARLGRLMLIQRLPDRSPPGLAMHPLVHERAAKELGPKTRNAFLKRLAEVEQLPSRADRYRIRLALAHLASGDGNAALDAVEQIESAERALGLLTQVASALPDAGERVYHRIIDMAKRVAHYVRGSAERALGMSNLGAALPPPLGWSIFKAAIGAARSLPERDQADVFEAMAPHLVKAQLLDRAVRQAISSRRDKQFRYTMALGFARAGVEKEALELARTLPAGARREAVTQALAERARQEKAETVNLRILQDLARAAREKDDFAQARSLQERALDEARRTLGPEHPETLLCMQGLAVTLIDMEDLQGALELLQVVVVIARRTLGVEHEQTLGAMEVLAETRSRRREYDEALTLWDTVVEARERTLGSDHPLTQRGMEGFAVVLRATGDLERARRVAEAVLEGKRRRHGDKNPETVRVMHLLAGILRDAGDFSAARAMDEQALDGARLVLGEEHPLTRDVMERLAEPDPEPEPATPTGRERIRILYLVADPENRPLQLEADYTRIEEDLRSAKVRERLEFIPVFAARIDDMVQAVLERPYDIIHFSGAGYAEGMVMRNEEGESSLVADEAIGQLLGQMRNTPLCVLLHSCWKESLARSIKNSVPYVVGTSARMSDEAGLSFLRGFYTAIAAGKDVPFAFEMGRTRVQMEGSGEELFLAFM
jgi:hypothetical protein